MRDQKENKNTGMYQFFVITTFLDKTNKMPI